MMGGHNPRPIKVTVHDELTICEGCDARNYTPASAPVDASEHQSPILEIQVERIVETFFVTLKLCPACCVRLRAAIDEAEFSFFGGAPQEVS